MPYRNVILILRHVPLFVLCVTVSLLGALAGCGSEAVEPAATPTLTHTAMPLAADAAPGRYIVTLHDDVQPGAATRDLAGRHGVAPGHVYGAALRGFTFRGSAVAAERIKRDPRVAHVEPDGTMHIGGQVVPTGVRRIGADQNPVANINGIDTRVDVGVAILDTGIDLEHPDLNVVQGVDCHLDTGCAAGPDAGHDTHGHGTHVAGIAAALDNDFGVVGVAPGARLYAVKIMATSSGRWSDVIAGLDWVVQNSDVIDVVNLSITGSGCVSALRAAVQATVEAGIYVAVAAGNSSRDISSDGNFGNCNVTIPAAYAEVATISAMADYDGEPGGMGPTFVYGEDDSFASFSNFSAFVQDGNPVDSPGGAIDLLMPGARILSTCLGGTTCNMVGTSMASPHAAGLAALHIAGHGRPTNAAGVYALRQALIDNAWAQNSPQGLNVLNDPDAHLEPIGSAIFSDPGSVPQAAAEIKPSSQEAAGLPGESVSYDYRICNVGNSTDSFTLSTTSQWESSIQPATLTSLDPGECAMVVVTHDVPPSLTDADSDGGTLTAISASTGARAFASFRTSTPTFSVEVAPSNQSGSGAPGAVVTYHFSVCNRGNIVDTYALSGSSVWTASVTPEAIVELEPDDCASATVHETISSNASEGDSFIGALIARSTTAAVTETGLFITTVVGAGEEDDSTSEEGDSAPEEGDTPEEGASDPEDENDSNEDDVGDEILSLHSITPDTLSVGTSTTVTIEGVGIGAGASLKLENGQGPAPDISSVTVEDSTSLTATITVKRGGPKQTRRFDVRVTNPDSTSSVLPAGLTIVP